MHILRSNLLRETKVNSTGNELPTSVLIWSFDCGKRHGFFSTLQSSLITPSEAALSLRLLAWARVTGEILILLFWKGRRLALSVTTGPLVRDAQLESVKPASLAAHGAVKPVGKSKADSSTWIKAPEVGAFMKYQKVTEVIPDWLLSYWRAAMFQLGASADPTWSMREWSRVSHSLPRASLCPAVKIVGCLVHSRDIDEHSLCTTGDPEQQWANVTATWAFEVFVLDTEWKCGVRIHSSSCEPLWQSAERVWHFVTHLFRERKFL